MGAVTSHINGAFCDVSRVPRFPCEYNAMSDRNVPRHRMTDFSVLSDIPVPQKGLFALGGNGSAPSDCNTGFVCRQGRKPTIPNQDDFCIIRQDGWAIYGVADGHGVTGHTIASTALASISASITENAKFPRNLPSCFADAFRRAQKECEEGIDDCDASTSGASVTIVVTHDNCVETAHVGDARGVQGVKQGRSFRAFDLTRDHRCDVDDERKRLELCGGVVRPGGGSFPSRLYGFGREEPGLSISRSIGDTLAHGLGVSASPDIEQTALASPGFIIVASDGIWTFITSQEAVDIVKKYPKEAQKAADNLYQVAATRWVDNDTYVDDVTIIIAWH